MNGVRRFLGNPPSTTTSTPTSNDLASTSSRPSSPSKELPPPPPIKGLFIRKDRKPPPSISGPSSTTSSPPPSTPPPRRKVPPSGSEGTHTPSHSQSDIQQILPANTRDALLLSLLSSEAMVDSRGYEILSAEEVEELKKEHTVLSSRVGALQRKLATEVKIRDAAQTLARLNATSSPTRISRQSSGALETAESKVQAAQTELWRVQERATNVSQRLLEHRAGALGAALAEAERGQAKENTATFDTDISLRSPLSSPAQKFDGAHLFAGHEDAVVPGMHSRRMSALGDSVSTSTSSRNQKELEELEARLVAAEDRAREREAELENARGAAVSELEDVRAAAEEELARARAVSASELARAEERVARLERELELSIRGREDSAYLEERIRTLECELEDAERMADRARTDAAAWASERALFEREIERCAGVSETLDKERELWEQEREELAAQAKDQIADAADGLRSLIQRFDVPLFSRESGLGVLVDALGRYLEKHNAQLFEQILVAEAENRNAMTRELEVAKAEIQMLQTHSSGSPFTSALQTEPRPSSPISFAKDAAGFAAILQPLWATLPSPEARAARLSSAARPFRAGNGRASPSLRSGGGAGSPSPSVVSISDMDVRALKTLYNTPGGGSGSGSGSVSGSNSNSAGPGRASSPSSPIDNAGGVFSVEAFAQRVQSLISDDRALMERLIRFAQAHDLLKKNAERAQKLALESNVALETYQRQVRTLEENLAVARSTDGLEDQVEQLRTEKLAAEERAAEQAQTLRELGEANAALSARALQLAQDAATAQEELGKVRAVSEREQEQRLALLEEINLVQTENGSLRQQLRALGKL